jgi:hypothetical protein
MNNPTPAAMRAAEAIRQYVAHECVYDSFKMNLNTGRRLRWIHRMHIDYR